MSSASARISRTSACRLERVSDHKPFDECYKNVGSVFREIIVLTDSWIDDDGVRQTQQLSPVATGRTMILHDLVAQEDWDELTNRDVGLSAGERFDRYEYLSDCNAVARLRAVTL